MDEATSALDNTSEKMIQQILGVKRKKLVDSEEGPDGSKEGVPGCLKHVSRDSFFQLRSIWTD